jgi:antitoxin component of MazEF toxin-antitoxin module
MSLKIISFTTISSSFTTTISKDVLNILKLHIGEEVIFTLKDSIVYVKKYFKNIKLLDEIYLSSAKITGPFKSVRISPDVIKLIDADKGDKILWIIDSNRNIILRNNFLPNRCSKKFINKDLNSVIIGLTRIGVTNTPIPIDVRDLLGLVKDDVINISLDIENVIISKEMHELNQPSYTTKVFFSDQSSKSGEFLFYIKKEIKEFLKLTDKILWIIDENGDISMRNNDFPEDCL